MGRDRARLSDDNDGASLDDNVRRGFADASMRWVTFWPEGPGLV